MITIREFYRLYNRNSPDNKNRRIGSIDARMLLRDLSLYPAYFCAKTNISANLVTAIFLLLSLLGNYLFSIPNPYTTIGSILLYELAQLVDCIDGQLARYYGSFSFYGHIFDNFCHTMISSTFMIAFGVRMFSLTNNVSFLILSGFGALSFAFSNLWFDIPQLNELDQIKTRNFLVQRLLVFIYTITDEIRFFILAIFILSTILSLFHLLHYLEYFYVAYVFFTFLDKVIYRFYVVIRASHDKQSTWHGWRTINENN